MAVHPSQNRPPSLKIRSNNRRISASSTDGKPVKAPGRKISSFFGWRTASPTGSDSSSTDLFDADYPRLSSPLPSMPHSPMSTKPTTTPIDVSKANGIFHPSLGAQLSSSSSQTPGYSTRINELEKELRDVSSELASSIRREMELEDLVDRLQSEMPSDDYPRTSDYFSDSGASSIRYSSSRIEELEKTRRAAEQERARLKVELSQRLQEEISQRTASESHVHILEAQVQQLRRERVDLSDLASKNRELEIALEDTRRKLAEERQVKDNFEDLLTAVRVEIEQLRNERDHLRDVVVPQLQSQNNTMAPASDHFEIDQLLGEIAALKVENASLAQLQGGSLARMPSKKATSLAHSGSLSRSNSVAKRDRESRESLAERVKDIEEQRDALHQTLKSLLFRHAYEAREHERRVKALELELEHATQPGSRGKLGYEREVYNLRDEINRLRQRAEDALVQKWQCEKGLAGLKMDLDRAEQQTTSLRMLLQEHDIDVPEEITASREVLAEVQATSSSLEFAYEELQADRQYAEAKFSESPDEYSAELMASVDRTQNLSNYVRQQLKANESLRGRLAHAIGQGEEEQQISASRINELQNRLKELEDQLLAAQQHSEEEVAKHEDEVNRLKETHHRQILRLKNGSRTPVLLSPQLPNSPFFARSPRLDRTTSGDGIPLNEAVQTENLERMVKELEKALRNADLEMEEVISRMNRAQIDVAELQSDRDDALRQTRKLQAEILAERQAFKALMG
ncbi:hypothetical protein MAP00_000338 [Monascus purpureus]|nr:hypothetical protein MAP00_000338 [Monascus purpureus]